MNTRATWALLAALAILGAAALFVQGPGRRDRQRERAAVFPGLKAAEVAQVRIARAGAETLLARDGEAWKLGAAKEPADKDAVEALLANLAEARVGAVVSTNAAKQGGYEADADKGIVVGLEGAGGRKIASFIVGKRGPDFASSYLRHEGSSEVLLVSRDLRLDLSRPAEAWWEPPKEAGSPGSGGAAQPPPP